MQVYKAIKYIRLSYTDDKTVESDSVANQRRLIDDYIARHPEIEVVAEKIDDGYSGVLFDRPAFQEMMRMIEQGEANCVIVKDLSRLGREYIETGRYMRRVFPAYGVRFIAINDNVDTENDAADDLTVSVKNIMNEAYCRDISVKTRSALEVKRRSGDFVGAFTIYGYVKVGDKHKSLEVDEYAANVVRDIFRKRLEGFSASHIADELNRLGILSPLAYKRNHGIVSVPTPYDKFSKKVDACYVVEAVKDVMRVCPKGATVVVESTVSPGTIDKYVRPVIEANGFKIGEDINLVHAPERIIPGNMVYELLHNNRTIGADDKAIGEKVKKLYSSFCQGEIVVTDIRTAEMTKVVENTFRAVNIAFANELAKICRHDNMDVYEIIKICNMHPRVNILQPGPGVGGHCISVDPWFLVGDYPSLAKVIDESMKTNDGMPDFVLNRIYEIMKEKGLADVSRVGLYGLTYKENVDDMRESPTLQLLESQERHLATGLKVYDPFITKDVVKNQYHDLDAFLADVDMVVVMVKHTEIRENVDKLAGKVVLDCHNVIDLPGVYHI